MNLFIGLLGVAGGALTVVFHRQIYFSLGKIGWAEKYLGAGNSDWGYIIIGLVAFIIGLLTLFGVIDFSFLIPQREIILP
jgi:hypothetical protein